jgi:transcriptional regulator with XRE-family HTH domain
METAASASASDPDIPASFDLIGLLATSIRRERERAGLSMTELAKRARIAKSTLSQLESGTGNPSVETLWALATALGVQFSRLVEPPRPQVRIIRAGQRPVAYAEHSSYAAALLSSSPQATRRDLYWAEAEPGSIRHSEPHPPGTIEHVVICTGAARLGPTGDPVRLERGDYVTYPGDAPHVFEALEPNTAAVFLLEYT